MRLLQHVDNDVPPYPKQKEKKVKNRKNHGPHYFVLTAKESYEQKRAERKEIEDRKRPVK